MSWTYIWIGIIAVVWNVFFVLLFQVFKKKFIPASDYVSAVEISKRLQNEGFTPIINLLGEHYTDRKKINQTFRQYLWLVDALHEAGIRGKISVKPTQLGLVISKETYCDFIWRLARRTYNQKIPLEIDMENLKYLDDTLEIFQKIPGEYGVRQAVQSYLKRSKKDIREFINQRRKIRLVKGAYAEGDLNKPEMRIRMKNFAEQFLVCGIELAVATIKDKEFIDYILKFVDQRGISNRCFVIQTLYGVGDDLKKKWRDEGFRVEVYIPIGPWHKALPYIWRRMKEIIKFYI